MVELKRLVLDIDAAICSYLDLEKYFYVSHMSYHRVVALRLEPGPDLDLTQSELDTELARPTHQSSLDQISATVTIIVSCKLYIYCIL